MGIERELFGTAGGTPIELYTLRNEQGMRARVMTYAGTLVSLEVPEPAGELVDVVLGFDSLPPYLGEHPYFGALIGRYGNRIAGGTFTLDGRRYQLPRNNGPNHLHGGDRGFHRAIWQAQPAEDAPGLTLTYLSRDGEQGYPANLTATVTYTLAEPNALRIDYSATTDAPTIVNLTNHSYFNLAGAGTILDHQLQIAAQYFLPVDETLIPIGELRPVDGTPMDFRAAARIGARIGADEPQLQLGPGGFDHTWVLDGAAGELRFAARLIDPASGRTMEVYTTQPGLQFYSGNFLDGSLAGKGGQPLVQHAGLCLETQHFPDSPNQPTFPSTVLEPGAIYRQTTVFRFSVSPGDA
jgi:aldose 1-epimerase